jgi:TatA/E family protein of Tat protein translocase
MFALIDSDWGIILIVVAVLVLFGGSKLPKLFHSLGSAQAEYKRGLAEGQAASEQTAPQQAVPQQAVPQQVLPQQAVPQQVPPQVVPQQVVPPTAPPASDQGSASAS